MAGKVEIGNLQFVVVSYNINSAMSQPRLVALMANVADMHWDIIVLCETWREAAKEQMKMDAGHMFYGSGGTKGSSGVGFVVHE